MTYHNQPRTTPENLNKIFAVPVDDEFNDIAKLAANVLNVPFVLVVLSSGESNTIKTGVSFENNGIQYSKPQVAISVSSKAYLPEDLVRKHPEVIKSALSESDDLDFYATAPLVDSSGQHLGTLYAFDRSADLWGSVHWEILDNIAKVIIGQLEVKIAAQEIIRSQQDMAFKLAHDFRGSVCNIPVLVKMIREENNNPEKQKALGNMIVKAAEKGLHAVDSLQLNQQINTSISAGQTRVNLSELVRKAAVDQRPIAARKRLHLNLLIEPNIRIPGNEKNLNKLSDHLLENAIKFAYPDQTIDVILVRSKDYILLEVRDEGVGMSKSDIADAMQKVESLSDRRDDLPNATGVGLWMVNEVVSAHGGKVSLKSRGKNKGTTVTVMLPNNAKPSSTNQELRQSRHQRNTDLHNKSTGLNKTPIKTIHG